MGEFHNIVGALATPLGVSIWDTRDMEYFIELVAPPTIPIRGCFGRPPEEGGFQYVEGLRIGAVERVIIKQVNRLPGYDVRELHILAQKGADLKWDLFVPGRAA